MPTFFMAIPIQHRQGDVYLIPVSSLPSGLVPRESKVIIEGEISGHKHMFAATAPVTILDQNKDTAYVDVKAESTLFHEDHSQQQIKAGVYKICVQREKTFDDVIRRVND
jgi:hypothetical protein